jgi:hypothetical protein
MTPGSFINRRCLCSSRVLFTLTKDGRRAPLAMGFRGIDFSLCAFPPISPRTRFTLELKSNADAN